MAAYSRFLGGTVKVQYRLGDVLLSASGTFVADSGRSIFLEQHLEQRGKRNYFRWEIPYPYIHRIESMAAETETAAETRPPAPRAAAASAGAGDALSDSSAILPFNQGGTTA
jgi:hypothetical protein